MTKRNLILVHRGPEYERDFDEIAAKVNALDRDITVYHLPCNLRVELPVSAWQYPTLTVALMPNFLLPIRRGTILRNQQVQKLTQQDILLKNNIPTPPALRFRFGAKLDPIVFGDFVLLKPINLTTTSTGDGIRVMRRARAEKLTSIDIEPLGLLSNSLSEYIVQRFCSTGTYATSYRVMTFLGVPITSEKLVSKIPSPLLSSEDQLLERGHFITKGERNLFLESEEDVLELAAKTARCFDSFPLLGIDIIRDVYKKLWVLEVNAGGNTWHYSSKATEARRQQYPEYYVGMKTQFGAFDLVSRRLVEEVHCQAS